MERDIDRALEFFDGVMDRNNWVMNYPYGNYNENVIEYINGREGKGRFWTHPQVRGCF